MPVDTGLDAAVEPATTAVAAEPADVVRDAVLALDSDGVAVAVIATAEVEALGDVEVTAPGVGVVVVAELPLAAVTVDATVLELAAGVGVTGVRATVVACGGVTAGANAGTTVAVATFPEDVPP